MLLAIEQGNTNSLFAVHDGGDWIAQWRSATEPSRTAITLDVIGSDGGFEGGVIAPGVHLSMEALHAAAAKLPRIALQRPRRVIGDDTVSAIQSGVFWGHVALLEGMIARIKAERN